jgi:hypothetical protein
LISIFKLDIILLNLDYKAEKIKKDQWIGEGAYGKIKI